MLQSTNKYLEQLLQIKLILQITKKSRYTFCNQMQTLNNAISINHGVYIIPSDNSTLSWQCTLITSFIYFNLWSVNIVNNIQSELELIIIAEHCE